MPPTARLALYLVFTLLASACSGGSDQGAGGAAPPAASSGAEAGGMQLMEAACGSCQFGLPGSECALAVRFDGQAYYVDGTSIDEHGDAHAADGFCNMVRKARVGGQLEGERFHVTAFELQP